jgi:dTDP-4-amino-4,6-dideoxygalactose transaminase
MTKVVYNPWPNGKVPKHLQRPEIDELKRRGYVFDDPREIVSIFEEKVAKFAGSKYAVSVDCCTHAIELSFRYMMSKDVSNEFLTVGCPKHTYISAALVPMQLGLDVEFEDNKWEGKYLYSGTNIVDAAVLWEENMYQSGTLHCVSFQIKKIIPIGRGGMILTDDKNAYEWLKLASYDGRDLTLPYDHPQHLKMRGWHYYMTPEDCSRGIVLMDDIKQEGNTGTWESYPDITKMLKL